MALPLHIYAFFCFLTDTKPPVINCTQDMVVSTEPGLYYATLNLTMPVGHGKRAEQCFLFLLIHILRKHRTGRVGSKIGLFAY